jgi:AAA+ ATPase superfamily predicted ATPase
LFDEKTDIITYEDLLKDPNLDKETKLRYEKLKLERDRKLVIEKADNSLLLYDFEDKSFICQGKTVQELAKNSKEYGGVDIAVVVHDKEHYYFINGAIKDAL